jgi:hypothetical protein
MNAMVRRPVKPIPPEDDEDAVDIISPLYLG